ARGAAQPLPVLEEGAPGAPHGSICRAWGCCVQPCPGAGPALQGQHSPSLCVPPGPYSPSECCFGYLKRPLRLDTLLDCPKPAVVIVAGSGDQICADPKKDWVAKTIKRLQKKITTPSPM
uniref:Chemokine interleukin-8-like domain-containing protein n=1 Tax=Catharus ustulatus TaxID=91951 RepID=A0A8C3UWG5_CATUS